MNPEVILRLPKTVAFGVEGDTLLIYLTGLQAQSVVDQLVTVFGSNLTIERIEELVSQVTRIPIDQFHKHIRPAAVIRARRLCFQLAREKGWPDEAIAQYFGLDRTTVLYHLGQKSRSKRPDQQFDELLSNIRARI